MAEFIRVESNVDNAVARIGEMSPRAHAALEAVVEELSANLFGAIQAKTPVRSGALKRSERSAVHKTSTGVTAEIDVNPTGGDSKGSRRAFYAIFVEYGAKLPAHDLRAKDARALHFMVGGNDIFRGGARFPGGVIEAAEFLHGPFRAMKPKIISEIRRAVQGAL